MTKAIEVEALQVSYGTTMAVRDVSFSVERGEIFGFLGPNGAGKSTTIRVLLDLLRPVSGRVRVLGQDVHDNSTLRRSIGYLPGDLSLPEELNGIETLRFFERLQGRGSARRDHVLERLGFPKNAIDRRVRTYSTGMRQMIGITSAMQHSPEVLILDEPTTGLDPIVRDAFAALIGEAAADGATVFFSSHVLSEVESSATRAALILEGAVRRVDAISDWRAAFPRHVVLRYADGRTESFRHAGSAVELLDRIARDGLVDVIIRPADLSEIFKDSVRNGVHP